MMANTEFSMPMAVPPNGVDPLAFYATFAGRLLASWMPATGLEIWVAADIAVARLHAPIKAAMRFVPAGTPVGGAPTTEHTIVLQTWPVSYVAIQDALASTVPSEIHMENIDPAAVRQAVTPLFEAIGRSAAAIDAFMAGDGLLRVNASTAIGAAAPAAGAPAPATPNRVRIQLFDSSGRAVNPVQFFSDTADHVGIDKTQHPLLSQLDLSGWVEIFVTDASGVPLANEPYVLYLGDGSNRMGNSDASGRIFEAGIPAGGWALDAPNHPSFALREA
jgi:hypothetical protein